SLGQVNKAVPRGSTHMMIMTVVSNNDIVSVDQIGTVISYKVPSVYVAIGTTHRLSIHWLIFYIPSLQAVAERFHIASNGLIHLRAEPVDVMLSQGIGLMGDTGLTILSS